MVPLSFLGQSLQARVFWDADKDTIFMLSPVHKNLTVEYIDVGQGDSIYLSCGGHNMLIDAGEQGDEVRDYIYGTFANSLEYLVATHPDADHIGGIDEVLKSIPAKKVFTANLVANTNAFRDMLDALTERELGIFVPQKGEEYPLGNAKIKFLSSEAGSTSNNSSLVFKVEYGNTSFLFPGDAEEPLEQSLLKSGANIKCDVLKVGHHGSDTSTSDAFLAAAAPKAAVISCGKDNPYGHPSAEVLNKLAKAKIPVYRTDVSGNIVVVTNADGSTYEITANNPAFTLQPSLCYPERSNVYWYASDFPFAPEPLSVKSESMTNRLSSGADIQAYIAEEEEVYHSDLHCNNRNYFATTLGIVQYYGRQPCPKCVKPSDIPATPAAPTTTTTTTPAPESETNNYYEPEPEPNYYHETESIPHFHPTEPEERKIYITRTGKRYHYNPHCNGGTYYESTLEEALSRGLTPCHKCVLK